SRSAETERERGSRRRGRRLAVRALPVAMRAPELRLRVSPARLLVFFCCFFLVFVFVVQRFFVVQVLALGMRGELAGELLHFAHALPALDGCVRLLRAAVAKALCDLRNVTRRQSGSRTHRMDARVRDGAGGGIVLERVEAVDGADSLGEGLRMLRLPE